MDYAEVARRIDKLVRSTGMENAKLSDAMDMTPTQISHHRRGVGHPPGISSLIRYADYFGVSVDWILGRADDQKTIAPTDYPELVDLYMVASPDDKELIQTILKKYKNK